jgi:hypothetical protein
VPANRSRTTHWRRCLEQVHERGGAIEIAVARDSEDAAGDAGEHLVWRVRVLALSADEIVVEQPVALGQTVPLAEDVQLVAMISVGQNRWRFDTVNLGSADPDRSRRSAPAAVRLRMPTSVKRCSRRRHERLGANDIGLPKVDIWPLLDPRSVVLAERASQLRFEKRGADANDDTGLMPEVGPKFNATLVNLGGGGVGLHVPPEHAQAVARHKLFWIQLSDPPELEVPICASAKLVHTHLQSDQNVYAGLAFDFTFNAPHQHVVATQICDFVETQQRLQRPPRAA